MASKPGAPCELCEQVHPAPIAALGPTAPDAWLAASPGERLEAELTPDVCILPHDGTTRHFIRGHLQLPLRLPEEGVFVWAVWVELEEDAMRAVASSWTNPNRAASAPLTGTLATELPYCTATAGLKVSIHTRDPGQPPLLMVPPAIDHPLGVQQRQGVGRHQVARFAELMQR